jgi:hypothetical protein
VTVQRQLESAVTERYQQACVGSSLENGATLIQCALRPLALQREWGTPSPIWWRQAVSPLARPARSPCHHSSKYRLSVAHGSSRNDKKPRVAFPPALPGVSTSQPLRQSRLRLGCALAVVGGGSLRPLALIFAALCLMPLPQASRPRWLEDMGSPRPTPEARRRHLRARPPAPACPIDGDDPLGTAPGGMVVQEEPARILMTHEAAAAHGDDARPWLQRLPDLGRKVTAAGSDDAHSFPAALNAVAPQARWPADQFPTVKPPVWGHLKTSLFSSRRQVKTSGAAQQDEAGMAWAQP